MFVIAITFVLEVAMMAKRYVGSVLAELAENYARKVATDRLYASAERRGAFPSPPVPRFVRDTVRPGKAA